MKQFYRVHWNKMVCCILAAGLVAGMAGCSPKAEPVIEQEKEIFVETQTPAKGDLKLRTAFIGTVEPDELVSVFPKVSGTVLKTNFAVGEPVKKGDVLFEIDSADIQLSVNVAQAQLMSAQAQMDQALGSSFDMQMTQLESQLKQAQNAYSTARQSLRDYNGDTGDAMDDLEAGINELAPAIPLLEAEYATASTDATNAHGEYLTALKDPDVDETDTEAFFDIWQSKLVEKNTAYAKLQEASSSLSMMRSNYNNLDDGDSAGHAQLRAAVRNAQTAYESTTQIYELTKDKVHSDAIKVANAQLGMATAAFESQARQLDYTSVVSPIDGVIEQKNVVEQGMTAPSNPAYTVSNKATLMVTFYVPAGAVEQMSIGDKVTIEYGQKSCSGALAEIGTMVDHETGLFQVKAAADSTDPALLTGLSVKITAETAKAEKSLLIPQNVVYYEDGAAYVYLLEENHAVKTPIEVGISNQESVAVISGVTADSKIISTWHPNLTDGIAVTPAPAAPAAAPTATPTAAPETASGSSGAVQEG